MNYGLYRTGDNQPNIELREVAKIEALRRIATALEALVKKEKS